MYLVIHWRAPTNIYIGVCIYIAPCRALALKVWPHQRGVLAQERDLYLDVPALILPLGRLGDTDFTQDIKVIPSPLADY